jgi:hypothetical protein
MRPRTLAEVLASPDGAFVAPVMERLLSLINNSEPTRQEAIWFWVWCL